jgi:2-polyprenyl-3-methyl-5-hydroxy-6-metoxy-1,4-benzoquinol methylase
MNTDRLNELLGRIVGDVGGAMSAALVLVGDHLGLYKGLAVGPQTAEELAGRTGTNPRMVREWLLNQAAGGYIAYQGGGKYALTEEQAAAFADEHGPASMQGAFQIITSIHRDVDKIERAFRSGDGLPWGAHDTCLFCGTERFFAAGYRASLLSSWIPALAGGAVARRLTEGAQIADIGCGHGASTLLMAGAYPRSRFIGFDFHEPSIRCASERARAAGTANASFAVGDAASFPGVEGGYDLVCSFDCLHDMGDPSGCARRVRETIRPGGVWMVVEPNAADTIEGNLNPISRVFSAASTAICVPASLATGGPALGACAGPAKLAEIIKSGGFSAVRIAASTPFNIVLEATA